MDLHQVFSFVVITWSHQTVERQCARNRRGSETSILRPIFHKILNNSFCAALFEWASPCVCICSHLCIMHGDRYGQSRFQGQETVRVLIVLVVAELIPHSNMSPKQHVILICIFTKPFVKQFIYCSCSNQSKLLPAFKRHHLHLSRSYTYKYGGTCVCVRTHLSPAEFPVTCSAESNLCGGSGDTMAHAEMASFLSANPCVLSHTSSPCWQFHPRHDLSGPQAADKGAPARVLCHRRINR